MTREEIRNALGEVDVLACTIFGEIRNGSMHDMAAVGCVIRNRADRPGWWGKDLKSVCLAPSQFSCWWEGEHANTRAVYDMAAALLDDQPLGDRSLVAEICWLAQGIAANVVRDTTHGADHYLTTALFRSPTCPAWARGQVPVYEAGGHSFFRLTT